MWPEDNLSFGEQVAYNHSIRRSSIFEFVGDWCDSVNDPSLQPMDWKLYRPYRLYRLYRLSQSYRLYRSVRKTASFLLFQMLFSSIIPCCFATKRSLVDSNTILCSKSLMLLEIARYFRWHRTTTDCEVLRRLARNDLCDGLDPSSRRLSSTSTDWWPPNGRQFSRLRWGLLGVDRIQQIFSTKNFGYITMQFSAFVASNYLL